MPVVGEIRLPSQEFVLGQVLSEVGDHRAELTQFVPLRDQFVPYFWIEHGNPSEVAPTLESHPKVSDVDRYAERAGRTLYGIEWAGPLDEFLSILMEQDVLVTQASGTPEYWDFELLVSEQEDISSFHQACTENDIPLEVLSVAQAGPSSLDRVGLTEKQRRILRLAHERGYFETPQQVTVAELGDELDISPQAASSRLRRGLEGMVDYMLTEW